MKNEVLIAYLNSIYNSQGYILKAEFSTNDNDKEVIVVKEQPGRKVVFFGDIDPLFNYFQITVWGLTIQKTYATMTTIGNLIGKHIIFDYNNQKWQIIFKQFSNPQAIEYLDIRRVGYTATLQCIVNQIA